MREMDRLGQAEKYKNQVQFEIQQVSNNFIVKSLSVKCGANVLVM